MRQFLTIGFVFIIGCVFQVAAVQAQTVRTENVVLITLDGLRWQEMFTGADSLLIWNEEFTDDPDALAARFWADTKDKRRQKLLPFVWGTVEKHGVILGNRVVGNKVDVTNTHVFSYPGYNEILTGFADERIDSNDKVPNPNMTVLEWLNNQNGFTSRVAAFTSWDVFPYIINEERSGVPVNSGFDRAEGNISDREALLNTLQTEVGTPWEWERFDAFTHHLALEYMKRRRPRVLYIAYGDTDEYAHSGNYRAYLQATKQIDAFIAELWSWLQSTDGYRGKTSLVITTDHGRGSADRWVGHGADWHGSEQIWIAVMGPDTPALGEVRDPDQHYQNQAAATLVALLGLEYANTRDVGKVIRAVLR